MKWAFVLAGLVSSLVSGTPIEKRQITGFDVTNFVAACTTDGTCSWSLNLFEAPAGPNLDCTGSAAAGPGNTFPTATVTLDCSVAGIGSDFLFVASANDYELGFDDVRTVNSTSFGNILLPAANFPIVSGAQVYTGPTAFNITRIGTITIG